MILFANILLGVALVLEMVLNFVTILVIVAVVLSWLRINPYHPVVRSISAATHQLYALPKRFMRTTFGAMEIAPILVLVLAALLQAVVVQSMRDYGGYIKMRTLGRQLERSIVPPNAKGRSL